MSFIKILIKSYGDEKPLVVNINQIVAVQEVTSKGGATWGEVHIASMGGSETYKEKVSYNLFKYNITSEQATILLSYIESVKPIIDLCTKGSAIQGALKKTESVTPDVGW